MNPGVAGSQEIVMLRIALAVLVLALPLGAASAAELPVRVVVKKSAAERVEVWGPCWARYLPFYDITDPDWMRPICLRGTRAVVSARY